MDATPPNIEGPFYRGPTNGYYYAPDRDILPPMGGAVGKELALNFTAHRTSGAAIGFYLVELWQADGNGVYDLSNPRDPTSPDEFWPNTAFYRTARRIVGGRFHAVWTVVPRYYIDPSGTYREPHIHVKVSLPQGSGMQLVLTTQLFPPRAANAGPSRDPYYDPRNTFPTWIDQGNRIISYFTIYVP